MAAEPHTQQPWVQAVTSDDKALCLHYTSMDKWLQAERVRQQWAGADDIVSLHMRAAYYSESIGFVFKLGLTASAPADEQGQKLALIVAEINKSLSGQTPFFFQPHGNVTAAAHSIADGWCFPPRPRKQHRYFSFAIPLELRKANPAPIMAKIPVLAKALNAYVNARVRTELQRYIVPSRWGFRVR